MSKTRKLEINDVTAFPLPGARVPTNFCFSEDKKSLYYLYAAEGTERALWRYDVDTNSHEKLFGPPQSTAEETFDEEMRRQRARQHWGGISAFDLRENVILVPYRGRLYLSRAGEPLLLVPGSEGIESPWLSQDGHMVFGVFEGNVVRLSIETGERHWLTTEAQAGVSYGLAEYIAQEELGRDRGYWLSPDEQWIIIAEADERHIPTFPIVHQQAQGVFLEEHRYPFVGKPNVRVRLGVRPVQGEDQSLTWLDWGSDERYLLDVVWSSRERFLVLTLSRDQKHLAWDGYDDKGTWQGRLYEETSPFWIERPGKSVTTKDYALISTSERNGLRRLLVVDSRGEARLLPEGSLEWAVLMVLAVDEASHQVYVWATRNRALERMLVRIDLETGTWTDLTPQPGWHRPFLSDDGSAAIDMWSTRERSPEIRLTSFNESRVIHQSATDHREQGLTLPEFFTVAADDGTLLNGLLYLPDGVAGTGGWPLVVSVYGGPSAQLVMENWAETIDMQAQYLVQRGFAVMQLDNRGSANRGPDFEHHIFGHFGDVELADQIRGVRYLSQHWAINLRRVGIFGWSFGGFMTLRALFMAPHIFRVGVAGAPVTDSRWYDTAYTERYLGTDENNHTGYESSGLIDKAGRLRGKLLLIHGMVDENVHFRHSAALIDALIGADKDFDLVVLPSSRHMVTGPEIEHYRTRKILQYFEQHL